MNTSERVAIVADDQELSRTALSAILQKRLAFRSVLETGSLDDALAKMDGVQVELALFDLDMPGMKTAASLLAVRECYPSVKVAVVSGATDRRHILAALEAGVHGYVPKTLGIEAITDALAQILDGRIYVPTSLAEVGKAEDARVAATADATKVNLTPRQGEVLALLVEGRSNKEISRTLQLGEGTVKVHLAALFRALGVQGRTGAAAVGVRLLGLGKNDRDRLGSQ